MKLYYGPMTCSLACRIAFHEAGADFETVEVDRITKRTADGRDYYEVNPYGTVPALERDDGTLLTENAAVLLHIARAHPHAELAPEGSIDELHHWLSYVGSELHKGVFYPLFDPGADATVKRYAVSRATARFPYVERHLASRACLLDRFSVADCYLVTILHWAAATPIDLADWPALNEYRKRHAQRSSVARSLAEELPRYRAQQRAV